MDDMLCDSCHVALTFQQRVDSGSDVINRYVCPECGKEINMGIFSCTLSPLIAHRPKSKGKYFCEACNFGTDCEICPCCREKLKKSKVAH